MGGKRGCALCGEMIDTGPRGTRRYCAAAEKSWSASEAGNARRAKKEKTPTGSCGRSAVGTKRQLPPLPRRQCREGLSYGKYVSREWAKAHARLKKPAWAKEGADEK